MSTGRRTKDANTPSDAARDSDMPSRVPTDLAPLGLGGPPGSGSGSGSGSVARGSDPPALATTDLTPLGRDDERASDLSTDVGALGSDLSSEKRGAPASQGSRPAPKAGGLGRIGLYELEGELGRGGMGTVYRAWHSAARLRVALKVIKPGMEDSAKFDRVRDLFLREGGILMSIVHPNVVRCIDVNEALHDGKPALYMALEYLDGQSLAHRLRSTPVPVKDAVRLGREVALALHALHTSEQRILHRDVTPGNVFLTSAGGVKLLDFGLASVADWRLNEVSMFAAGSRPYMSPEQFDGLRHCTERSDLYSLGVTLFHAIAGRVPFEASTDQGFLTAHKEKSPPLLTEANPALTPEKLLQAAQNVITRLLAKKQEERYTSALEVAEELARAEGGSIITAPKVTRPEAERFRKRALKAVLYGALLAGAAFVGIGYVRSDIPRQLEEARALMERADLDAAALIVDRVLTDDRENPGAKELQATIEALRGSRDREKAAREEAAAARERERKAREEAEAIAEETARQERKRALEAEELAREAEARAREALVRRRAEQEAALVRDRLDALLAALGTPGIPDALGAAETVVRSLEGPGGEDLGKRSGWPLSRARDAIARARRDTTLAAVRKAEARGDPAHLLEAIAAARASLVAAGAPAGTEAARLDELERSVRGARFDAAVPGIERLLQEGRFEKGKLEQAEHAAREALLGLSRDDLAPFRELAKDLGPLGDDGARRAAREAWWRRLRSAASAEPLRAGRVARGYLLLEWAVAARACGPEERLVRRQDDLALGSESRERQNAIHLVSLAPFTIDAYEVDSAAYARFLEASPAAAPPGTWSGRRPPAGREAHPVRGVSFAEATAYAASLKKRLPSADEWEVAASVEPEKGGLRRAYPWGEEWNPDITPAGALEPRRAGIASKDRSPWGAFDMGGNVAEWTWVSDGGAARPVLKGGSFLDARRPSFFFAALRQMPDADYREEDAGLRTVRDVPVMDLGELGKE